MTRPRTAAASILVLVCSFASCVDNGRGSLSVDFDPQASSAAFVDSEDGLRIRVELSTYVDSDGEVLLDSALLVVNHDGASDALPDPDIETEAFPIEYSGVADIALEVPSPISDVTSFDAFCNTNGRSVDVTLRFFATSIDPDPEQPPPLTELSTSLPLRLDGTPVAPNVIDASPESSLNVGPGAVVKNVVSGPGETILFVASADTLQPTLQAYKADAEEQHNIGLTGFARYPRVASSDPDVFYVAGVDSETTASGPGPLRFRRIAGPDFAEMSIERDATSPQFETLSIVALQPTPSGVRAAAISAFPLLDPGIPGFEGDVPEGKYYGSFVIEGTYADEGLTLASVLRLEREIVSWVPLSDGLLQVSSELPPRSPDATLRIERLDTAGEVVWAHDEGADGHDVDADTLPDGTVLVAYELSSGFVEVLRLSGSGGSLLSRASFAGTHPTVAPYGADHIMLSFNGRVPDPAVVAPARPVPLLVELDAEMAVVRGVQIACAGSADLQRTADGSLLLVGAFGERFSLGEGVTKVPSGALILTKIAEPL